MCQQLKAAIKAILFSILIIISVIGAESRTESPTGFLSYDVQQQDLPAIFLGSHTCYGH